MFFCCIMSTLLNVARVASELHLSDLPALCKYNYFWFSLGVINSVEVISLPHFKQIAEFELKPASVSYITKWHPCCPSVVESVLTHWFSFLIFTLHAHHRHKKLKAQPCIGCASSAGTKETAKQYFPLTSRTHLLFATLQSHTLFSFRPFAVSVMR